MTYIKFEWIFNVCWILFWIGNIIMLLLYFRYLILNKKRKKLNLNVKEAQKYYLPYYEKMHSFLNDLKKERLKFAELEYSFEQFQKKYLKKTIEKSKKYQELVTDIKDFGIYETRGLRNKGILSKWRNRRVFNKDFEIKNEKFYEPDYLAKSKYSFFNINKSMFPTFIKRWIGTLASIFLLLNVASSGYILYFRKYYLKVLIVCSLIIIVGVIIYFGAGIEELIRSIIISLILAFLIIMVIYIVHEYKFVLFVLKQFFELKILIFSAWDIWVLTFMLPDAYNILKITSSRIAELKNSLNTLENEEKRNNIRDMFDDDLINWIEFIEKNISEMERNIKKYNSSEYKKKLTGDEQTEVAQTYRDYMILKKVLEQEVADDFETGFQKIALMRNDLHKLEDF